MISTYSRVKMAWPLNVLAHLVRATPMVLLCFIFGFMEAPNTLDFQRFAVRFLEAPIADYHFFNFFLGLTFVFGLNALMKSMYAKRKRSVLTTFLGTLVIFLVALATSSVQRPPLTMANLSLSLVAIHAFWVLSRTRHEVTD
jgi:hypothetical protein